VSDEKGKYVTGLQQSDIKVFEDDTPQEIASFDEGGSVPAGFSVGRRTISGTNVFVLLDTSNAMYDTLPRACDAVADFIRRLDPADSLALYTFSRNMWRIVPLTREHSAPRANLQDVVAGEDTALYNALLLTLRDAQKTAGRNVVVVFSNGPDNASVIRPADVERVAVNSGIPVYIVSTQDPARSQPTAKSFELLTSYTGGKLYWAPQWQSQSKALMAIHNDIRSSYTAGYYPAANSNGGFRRVRVEVVSDSRKKFHVRVRPGYDARGAFK
jgi:VWFA-related protein